jgi:hypothetical protein
MQKYTFLKYYGCCFGEKKLFLQASTGMSSQRRHVGKGMGSMLGEAVQIRLILLEPTFYRFHARALPLQE